MKILVVSPNLPYPADDGGRIRIFNLIKFLSTRHEVTLLCFAWEHTGETGNIAEMERHCSRVVAVPRKFNLTAKISTRLRHLLNFFSPVPWMVKFLESGEMKKKLKELLEKGGFDIVQLEYGYMALYADVVRKAVVPGKKPAIVVDEHNVEWALKFRISGNRSAGSRALERFYQWYEGARFLAWEKKKAPLIDSHLFVSAADAKIQEEKIPGIKAATAPNGVDTQYLTPSPGKMNEAPGLLFLGNMAWLPNEDAALYFAGDIFPEIKKKYPEMVFYIAGKGSSPAVKKLSEDRNIKVPGYVGDVREYYGKNVILVVPMRIGGGTRLKIVEAMSSGVPVVSTSVGCEGLAVKHGENILIADTPGAFALAVFEMIENARLREDICSGGRMLAQELYDWRSVVKTIEKVYSAILR